LGDLVENNWQPTRLIPVTGIERSAEAQSSQ